MLFVFFKVLFGLGYSKGGKIVFRRPPWSFSGNDPACAPNRVWPILDSGWVVVASAG